jgi:hypothetical protein
VGQPLPEGGNAIADGKYPQVFDNDPVDGSFAVSTPVDVLDVDRFGNQLLQVKVPTDQVATSFSSKSEGAINFSTDGQDLSFLGYNAGPNTLDTSNSNTPLGPTAPTRTRPARSTASPPTSPATAAGRSPTRTRSAATTAAPCCSTTPDRQSDHRVGRRPGIRAVARAAGRPGAGRPDHTAGQLHLQEHGQFGKDTNFRGLTVFDGIVYLTKGSGSNGTNSVYFIDTTGTACSSPNGVGLPVPGAPLPTLGGAPYRICVLRGFNDAPAKGSTAPRIFPFGIWFASPDTLYVADEGDGVLTADANPYDDAAAQTNAGLQKWVFDSVGNTWKLPYTLQTGLGLGTPYTVPAYPTGTNPSPERRGLRRPTACGTSPAS